MGINVNKDDDFLRDGNLTPLDQTIHLDQSMWLIQLCEL